MNRLSRALVRLLCAINPESHDPWHDGETWRCVRCNTEVEL